MGMGRDDRSRSEGDPLELHNLARSVVRRPFAEEGIDDRLGGGRGILRGAGGTRGQQHQGGEDDGQALKTPILWHDGSPWRCPWRRSADRLIEVMDRL